MGVDGRSLVADPVGHNARWQLGGRDSLWKCHAPGRTVLLNVVVMSKDNGVHLLPNLNAPSEPFLSVSTHLPIVRDGPWGLIGNNDGCGLVMEVEGDHYWATPVMIATRVIS